MEPQVNSLESELNRLEQTGEQAQNSSDPVDVALGVAVIEAVNQARAMVAKAQEDSKLAVELSKGLNNALEMVPGLNAIAEQLKSTDTHLNALADAFKSKSDDKATVLTVQLEKHTSALQEAVKSLGEYHATAIKKNDTKLEGVVSGFQSTVKNLIQEIDETIKVNIKNQRDLPVASFTAGKLTGVSEAVPVIIVDQLGKPVKNGGAGGSGGVAVGGSYVGPEAYGSPLESYKVNEIDDASTVQYYGFTNQSGAWYILRDNGTGSFRYTKGTTDFATNWTNRVGLTYDYYDVIF